MFSPAAWFLISIIRNVSRHRVGELSRLMEMVRNPLTYTYREVCVHRLDLCGHNESGPSCGNISSLQSFSWRGFWGLVRGGIEEKEIEREESCEVGQLRVPLWIIWRSSCYFPTFAWSLSLPPHFSSLTPSIASLNYSTASLMFHYSWVSHCKPQPHYTVWERVGFVSSAWTLTHKKNKGKL